MLALLLVLSQSWLSYAGIGFSSHAPAGSPWQDSATPATETGPHGHRHDDPEPHDRNPWHQHPHNAADHSHDKPNLSRRNATAHARATDGWDETPPVSPRPAPRYSFERPPRSFQ